MEMIMLNPLEVKVNNDLERFRKDMGDIKELGKSLKLYGQIQPIVINRDNVLIVGGRRLAACLSAGIEVKAVYQDTTDPIIMRELEIEENIKRKAFTPAEECLAVAELHKLKQAQHGETESGKTGGWSYENTGEVIGKTKGNVAETLALADAIEAFPTLKKCKNKAEMKKAVKSLTKLITHSKAKKEYEEKISKEETKLFELYHEDALNHMPMIETNSVDLLLTDPIYGIDIHDIAITTGGRTGGEHTSAGFKYSDDREDSLDFLRVTAKESFRFCKHNAHAFVFLSFENFYPAKAMFEGAGWLVRIKPMIWIKRSSGQCNVPHAYPSSCYEIFLYARKHDSRLIQEGKADWIQADPVTSTNRLHQAEKPVSLLKELIQRTCNMGSIIYDPACGSGSTLQAALELKMFPVGCDISEEAYNASCQRLKEYV